MDYWTFLEQYKDTINENQISDEKEVITKFGELFNPKNLDNLTADEFKSFLKIKNNKHWIGLQRLGTVTEDMNQLRTALKIILDEDSGLSIKERFDKIRPKNGQSMVNKLARAIITPILLVVYPRKYGVWNRRSRESLKKLNLFPKYSTDASDGEKYEKINQALVKLAEDNGLSPWQLDSCLGIISDSTPEDLEIQKSSKHVNRDEFTLEKYLQEFLIDNWDKVFGADLEILTDDDGELIGREFPCKGLGYIDILCTDKNGNYIVIELKKGKSSDHVLGQTQSYMGWVKSNLAKDKQVSGIIIANELDERLRLGLNMNNSISFKKYLVDFSLTNQN